ncbi:hypothetical protein I4U23_023406 [Adineta vaga]|nr:hypothetical protein I4U23_023406 [Adineta vaga]
MATNLPTTTALMMTIYNYLKVGVSINEVNVTTFRDHYRRISNIDIFDGHEIDKKELQSSLVQDTDSKQTQPTPKHKQKRSEEIVPTELLNIKCILVIKYPGKYMEDFLRNFLLRILEITNNNEFTNDDTSPLLHHNSQFLLHRNAILALFIHEQMRSLSTIRKRQAARLRLVEPLSITDEFGTWSYDHFRNLLEMELHPYSEESFPTRWILPDDTHIYCECVFSGSQQIRERESAADDRRRLFEKSTPTQELSTSVDSTSNRSLSELFANLHLIKLFIYHTFRFESALQDNCSLPKLEAACIDASFAEMREEGYADDGLFSTMREFFLPLTISGQELKMDRSHQDLNQLIEKVQDLEAQSRTATSHRWEFDEKITDLQKTVEVAHDVYLNDRSQMTTTTSPREQAILLKQLNNQWQSDRNHQPQQPVDKGLVKPACGFIMYGPPGTGKSEIMSKLSMKLGICMVGPPLAAGELNRPLVGGSERVIIALASRCYRVPYAMCCLSINEIDSLALKHDEDSSEGKVDKISVLLSLIDGMKDIPNLMIFCATNRLHMIDEAFLRRMSGKFFALEPDLIDRLVIATINFSGAACKAFTRAVTILCMATQRKRPNFHVNYQEALKIVDRTAQQYQIFLGSETLPRLLLRNLTNKSNTGMNHLSRRIYTGRIIVDLHGGSARIEIIETGGHVSMIEHKLSPNETSVQSLFERLTIYGKDRNVQLLQLIDLYLLASQGAYDEKKVFETLKERYDECVAYARSMIIYDLDALVSVNKSESDSSMGRSFSSSVVNQSVYTYVRARFREAVVEQQLDINSEGQQTVEKWTVAVIREPFLSRQFSSDVQFARTRREEDELEVGRRKAEDILKCVKYKDHYIENENKMELERQKTKYKWICCDATVTTGSGKHSCGEQVVGDERRRDRSQFDQERINRWEDSCRRNKEYNDKWLVLLENRT